MSEFTVKGFQNRYSTCSPFNCANTAMVLQGPVGEVHLFTGEGGGGWKLPAPISHSSECLWSRTDPRRLYYVHGNELRWFDVGDFTNWGVVHAFTEYQAISGLGESDVSPDGSFALCGDDREVFLYPDSGIRVPFAQGVESLYATPEGNILISWPTSGQWLFEPRKMGLRRITAKNGHKAVARDTDGTEIMVWSDNRDNGVWKYPLDGRPPKLLLAMPWQYAVHISCGPFALVSAFMPIAMGHAQIWKVTFDGVATLLHEWDGDFSRYELQPHAALSHDGSRYVYNSGDGAIIRVPS